MRNRTRRKTGVRLICPNPQCERILTRLSPDRDWSSVPTPSTAAVDITPIGEPVASRMPAWAGPPPLAALRFSCRCGFVRIMSADDRIWLLAEAPEGATRIIL